MNKYHILCGLTIILLALGTGCNKKKDSFLLSGPAETAPASILKSPFQVAVEPRLYELPAQALIEWRNFAKYKPALILYSNHPFLKLVPEDRRNDVQQLLGSGTAEEIERRTSLFNSNPLLISPETVSSAIDNGIISEIYLVLPNRDPIERISVEAFGKSAVAAGFLSQPEADTLTLTDGIINGTLRGIPLHILHPTLTAKIAKPAILHIDMGYFKGMYVNEIKTPAYDLLYNLVDTIKSSGFQTLTTTLSFSNQEADFSLESRFVIRDLADLLRNPDYMKDKTPPVWKMRADALFNTSMYGESQARELTAKSVQVAPNDAATHYAFALDLFEQGMNDEGFAELDKAVQLDKGYGLEYLALAEQGTSPGKRDKSIELLNKAVAIFPNNPLIRIELASRLMEAGRSKEARPIIAELLDLEWSKTFYASVPETLREMTTAAAVDPVVPAATQPNPTTEAKDPAKPAGKMPKFNHMGM